MVRKIIPIILANDFTDFKKKLVIINSLKPKAKMIQIDVSDGKFTSQKIFNQTNKIKNLDIPAFEAHLMVNDPLKHAKAWIMAGAKRILFHVEPFLENPSLTLPLFKSLSNSPFAKGREPLAGENSLYSPPLEKGGWGDLWKTINFIKQQNIEVGLCLNPETPITILEPYLFSPSPYSSPTNGGRKNGWAIDCVLILCVTPGKSGQKFQGKNLAKIRALRKKYPNLPIEVDGGVNLNNAKKIFQAGATRLSAASAILNADNPQKAYTAFLKLI
ncbi:MAG: hypothetical protein Q8M83_02305 [bacterium]|nr:hypothetical protein [bacterium]